MSGGRVKTGHRELAICIVAPLVVICGMIVFGFVYERQQEKRLAKKEALMSLIPALEQNVTAAHQALKPYVALKGTKDMAADLSLVVSDAAQKYGFTIRASNVEKQVGSGAGSWTDYKLTLSGEGALTSLIAMLDYLGQPQRRFHAIQVTLNSTRSTPEAMCSADLVLVSRVVADQNGEVGARLPGIATPAMAEEMGIMVGKRVERVKTWAVAPVTPLSIKGLQNRVAYVAPTPNQAEPEPQVSFRLTGVIRNKEFPMIMTDRGVLGVGDEVDGCRIETIGADSVSVVSKSGRRETIRLYKGGGGM
ncbi:MAG: hypothetical protein WCI20_09825 [bacterium]